MEACSRDPSALTFREKKTLFDHGTPILGRLNDSSHSTPTSLGPYFDKHCSKLMPNVIRAKPSLAPVRLFCGDTSADDSAALRQLSALRQRYSSKGILEVATQTDSSSSTSVLSKRSTPSRSPDVVAHLWLPQTCNAAALSKTDPTADYTCRSALSDEARTDPLHAVLDLLHAYVEENQRSGVPIDPRLAQALQAAQSMAEAIPPASQASCESSSCETPPQARASLRPLMAQALRSADSSEGDRIISPASTVLTTQASDIQNAPSTTLPCAEDTAADDMPTPFRMSASAWAATRASDREMGCAQLHHEAQALREQLRQRAMAQYANNRLAASAMERSLAQLHAAANAAARLGTEPGTAAHPVLVAAASPSWELSAASGSATATVVATVTSVTPTAEAEAAGAGADPVAALVAMSRERDKLAAQCARLQRQCNGLLAYISMLSGNGAAAGLSGRPRLHVGAAGSTAAERPATAPSGPVYGPAGAPLERVVVRLVLLPDAKASACAQPALTVMSAQAPGGLLGRGTDGKDRVDVEGQDGEDQEGQGEGEEWPCVEEVHADVPVRVRLQLRVVRTDPQPRLRAVLPLCVGFAGRASEQSAEELAHDVEPLQTPLQPPLQAQPQTLSHAHQRARLRGIREEEDECEAMGSDGDGDDGAGAASPRGAGLGAFCAAGVRSTGSAASVQASPFTSAGGAAAAGRKAEAGVPGAGPDSGSPVSLDSDFGRLWTAPLDTSASDPSVCSTRDSCRDGTTHFKFVGPDPTWCRSPEDGCAAAAAPEAADQGFSTYDTAASGRISAVQLARRPTPPCSPRTSPCSPTGSHGPASSLLGSCSAAAAGGSGTGAGCFEEGYYSEDHDLADSEWDELAAAAAANGPGALLSAVAFLREQLQLAHLEIVSLTTQLGNLSHQREGLRARACQHDAALQLLAINEGEALLEANRLRAQLASERAARARLSAQCEDLQNRLLAGFPDRPHLSMHHSQQHHSHGHHHHHHHHHHHPCHQQQQQQQHAGGPTCQQSAGQSLASPGRKALGAGLLSGPVGLGAASSLSSACGPVVTRGTRASSAGGSLALSYHHSYAAYSSGSDVGVAVTGPQQCPVHAPQGQQRGLALLPHWHSQQQPQRQRQPQPQLAQQGSSLPQAAVPRYRSVPRYRGSAPPLGRSADWTAAISALEGLKRAQGRAGSEAVRQVPR